MKRTQPKTPTGQHGRQRSRTSRPAPAKQAKAPLSAPLRLQAEERLRRQGRGWKPGAGSQGAGAATQRLVDELRVHQIELEMQNEELRRAQHELEVSREKYFDLYDLAPVGYLTLNEPGRILEANLTAARLLGVARTDLVRQPLTRFILRDDLGIFNQHRQQLFESRAPQDCELRLTRPGGAPFWVSGQAILVQDHGTGAPVCRLTLSDLTERKQAEANREGLAQLDRLAQLMKCANDIVLLTDGDGRILEANDRALETYGYSLAELRQKTIEDLRTPESRAELPHQNEQLETDGRAVFEAMNQRRNGAAFRVEISARFIEIAGVRHRLSIVRDITEREQTEKKMQRLSQEIIAAREGERKQVSSVLHHDVGSLAVVIAALLDAIEENLRSGKMREALKWTKRTRKLFDESVARLKKLAIELRPPELDVLGLCAALRQLFAQVTERGGTRIHFRETLGRRRLSGDTATILFRMAQEALTNALKHSRAKQVNVTLRATKEEITLTVRDNGKGFDTSRPRHLGTPQIGLHVMQEMAASAGGVFTLDSGRGKGTTMRVRLPLKSPYEHSRCHCR